MKKQIYISQDQLRVQLYSHADTAEKRDNQDKGISVSSELDEKEQLELREINDEELQKILEEHKNWLLSKGSTGNRATLCGFNLYRKSLNNANLQGANLRRAHLPSADLTEANLQEANLEHSNLEYADLRRADLRKATLQKASLHRANIAGANLCGANFHQANLAEIRGLNEAKLQYSNLEGAVGLLEAEFAQAVLNGANLPEGIKEFKALQFVEETSKNARKIFFAMLLGCVYSWLTIATTNDVRLITNSASSPLPIIGTEIPIAGFYWVAPFVLLGLYLYFHFYLESLWKGLASLPAIFPDGKPLEEKAYPWLLNDIVCRYFSLLKRRSMLGHMKQWITIFLAWWSVPLTLIGFCLRYLPRHEWAGTWLHIGLFSGSVALATIFYRICGQILRGKKNNTTLLEKLWRGFWHSLTPIAAGLVMLVISYGAINGVMPTSLEIKSSQAKKEINYFKITELVPWAFQKVGYVPFADFREKDISSKPNDYYKIVDDEIRFQSVKSAILKSRNLTFADMTSAFLVKADLRYANLKNACLRFARLQKAYLGYANLQNAYLRYANLQYANLRGANLRQADLEGAKLQKAYLRGANLQGADLEDASLREANLGNADLKQADLEGTDLEKADLEEATLQEADLKDAKLRGANLSGADMIGCQNITQTQLDSACGNEKTLLPRGLTIKKCTEKDKKK